MSCIHTYTVNTRQKVSAVLKCTSQAEASGTMNGPDFHSHTAENREVSQR